MRIKDKIFSKIEKKWPKGLEIALIHHILMLKYGWIPLEEFLKLPSGFVFNMLKLIEEDSKKEEKEYKKIKRR